MPICAVGYNFLPEWLNYAASYFISFNIVASFGLVVSISVNRYIAIKNFLTYQGVFQLKHSYYAVALR